jgi:hypothetical protein
MKTADKDCGDHRLSGPFDEVGVTALQVAASVDENDVSMDQGVPIKKLGDVFETCAKTESSMKVFLRVRPGSSKTECSTITVESDTAITTSAPDKSKRAQYTKIEERMYSFNRVFKQDSTQGEVFDHAVGPLVERFLQGECGVIFAYGMTNSGKTYTIQGEEDNTGLLPRLINTILQRTEGATGSDIKLSMLEIYKEKVYDLMNPTKNKLSLRDKKGITEVTKLSSHTVDNVEDAIRLLEEASSNRSKSKTTLNEGSSRSHAVYSITLTRVIRGKESTAVFQVVDLAGAERG